MKQNTVDDSKGGDKGTQKDMNMPKADKSTAPKVGKGSKILKGHRAADGPKGDNSSLKGTRGTPKADINVPKGNKDSPQPNSSVPDAHKGTPKRVTFEVLKGSEAVDAFAGSKSSKKRGNENEDSNNPEAKKFREDLDAAPTEGVGITKDALNVSRQSDALKVVKYCNENPDKVIVVPRQSPKAELVEHTPRVEPRHRLPDTPLRPVEAAQSTINTAFSGQVAQPYHSPYQGGPGQLLPASPALVPYGAGQQVPAQYVAPQYPPTQQVPAQYVAPQYPPTQQVPAQHVVPQNFPVYHAPAKHVVPQYAPAEHAPAQYTSAQHTPTQPARNQPTPAQHGPAQHGPAQHGPLQDTSIHLGLGQSVEHKQCPILGLAIMKGVRLARVAHITDMAARQPADQIAEKIESLLKEIKTRIEINAFEIRRNRIQAESLRVAQTVMQSEFEAIQEIKKEYEKLKKEE